MKPLLRTSSTTCRSKTVRLVLSAICLILLCSSLLLAQHADIVVDQNGGGDYRTISEAIEALPMFAYQRLVILVRNGIYEEKLRIDQNYVTLRGEHRDSTIIRYSILRSDWQKKKDFIGPAVLNINGDDFVLDNLTIENTQPEIGPHAFTIFGRGTRTIITRCNVISKGGDTVSLWNYKTGMYYHADCYFEGAVDFVCPRGWCFVRNSQFRQVKKTATLWHDGHYDPDQKFVIVDSQFDGVQGFDLGRHHYQAQFYLLGCSFSATMSDQPIYLHTYDDSTRNNPYFYGDRYYFHDSVKQGEGFSWVQDNLQEAPGAPSPADITPAWTFGGKWDPESRKPLRVTGFRIRGKSVVLEFSEIVSVRGAAVFRNQSGKTFRLVRQRFNDIDKLLFSCESQINPNDLTGELKLEEGNIFASVAGVYERSLASTFKIEIPPTEENGAQ